MKCDRCKKDAPVLTPANDVAEICDSCLVDLTHELKLLVKNFIRTGEARYMVRNAMEDGIGKVQLERRRWIEKKAKEMKKRGFNRWEIEEAVYITLEIIADEILDPLFESLEG